MLLYCYQKITLRFLFLISIAIFSLYSYELENPPAHISQEVWQEIFPYLLPEDHPTKEKLDNLFSKRITASRKSVKSAGFSNSKKNSWNQTTVATHPKIKGYWLKFFTDKESDQVDWRMCLKRIHGAQRANNAISTLGYQAYFVVPEKWIYLIPPVPPYHPSQKICLLIAKDMNVLERKENIYKWRSKALTDTLLKAFFDVITLAGLADSTYPFNCPFTKDGKIAFIDTEYSHLWPIKYHTLPPYLTREKQKLWAELVESL